MKVLILAGGMGTRLSEETNLIPKPMVEIDGKPILWHIMKIYSAHGYNDFIILLGYKGYVIKEYFANYFLHKSDVTFNMKENKMTIHEEHCEPWNVTLIDTGLHTMTGGRVKRAQKYVLFRVCLPVPDRMRVQQNSHDKSFFVRRMFCRIDNLYAALLRMDCF